MGTVAAGAPGTKADGRLARGDRTRQALAQALLELIAQGDLRPTARRLAEQAGVSPRLVFHHFADMESVLRAAVAIQAARYWNGLEPVPSRLPLDQRVRAVVAQRVQLYTAIAPTRRAGRLAEHGSPTLAGELERSHQLLRASLEATFGPELEATTEDRRGPLADALAAAGSWETWEQVDRDSGGAPARTTAALETLLSAVVDAVVRSPRAVDHECGLSANGGGTIDPGGRP
jgi:AcrR family transcriptional regulator